jgi:hypothetical protein
LPAMRNTAHPWGRALGRETFDAMLLDRARKLGAAVWQPCSLRRISGTRRRVCLPSRNATWV